MSRWWTGFAWMAHGSPLVLFVPAAGVLAWQFPCEEPLPPVPDTVAGLEAIWAEAR